MREASVQEVEAHINATNRHSGARDAWQGMPVDWGRLLWTYGTIALSDLPEVHPASKRDVKRYAAFAKKSKKGFPAIVVIGVPGDAVVADGAHRVAAARALGHEVIDAYVGVSR